MKLVELMQWHAPALFELTSDPLVTRYLGFRTHETVHDAARLIEQYTYGSATWFAAMDDSGRLMGVVGTEKRGHMVTMALYGSPKFRGFGRTAAIPLIDGAMMYDPDVWRIWAYCHVDNLPVQRVLERIGAEREGRMRRYAVFPNVSDEPQDCFLYGIAK